MKKEIIQSNCMSCGHKEMSIETICDTCGEKLSIHGYVIREIGNKIPIKLELGNVEYDFCSEACAVIFLTGEWKKRFTKGELDA